MDVAALVISIVAVLLSLVVAGWAVYLQWCMFRASTDQLTAIGKENASLAERIAMSLGQIHEAATSTRSSLDATVSQLVSGLLGRVGPSAEGVGEGAQNSQGDVEAWRVQQGVAVLRGFPGAAAVLRHLGGGASDIDTMLTELRGLRPDTESDGGWAWKVTAIMSMLNALALLAKDQRTGTLRLTAAGKQVAARLSEGTDD